MRALTQKIAEKLLEGFRAAPGAYKPAADFAGVNPKTAKKAWLYGLRIPGHPQFSEPFEEIIEREQVEARARLQREKEEAEKQAAEVEAQRQKGVREKAIKDVTEARTQEAGMVRASRMATAQALGALGQTGAAVVKLSALVRRALEEVIVVGDLGVTCIVTDPVEYRRAVRAGQSGQEYLRPMGVKEAADYTRTLSRFAGTLRQTNEAAQKALEMERLLLGEPGKIVGHVNAEKLQTMSPQEAAEHMAGAQRAVDRAQAKADQRPLPEADFEVKSLTPPTSELADNDGSDTPSIH